jgi:DNA polymerase III epsilon subunit-like protein
MTMKTEQATAHAIGVDGLLDDALALARNALKLVEEQEHEIERLEARVPNEQADIVRQVADEYGATITQTIRVLLNHSLRDLGAVSTMRPEVG